MGLLLPYIRVEGRSIILEPPASHPRAGWAETFRLRKTRPYVVVSPDEANIICNTVVVAPTTTGGHAYPTRVPCTFRRRTGYVVIDQLRTVDMTRVVQSLGTINTATQEVVLTALASFFAP